MTSEAGQAAMNLVELRDLEEARRFLLQGIWLQTRLFPPPPQHIPLYLEWVYAVAKTGEPLLPAGFVADVGVTAFEMDRGEQRSANPTASFSGMPAGFARAWEDQVLGRFFADAAFARASDALRGYALGDERARGLAFMLNQFRSRSQLGGVDLSTAVIRTMREAPPQDLLAQGAQSISNDGLMPVLRTLCTDMVEACRRTPELLSEADIRALENRIALADSSQQLAHEQVMVASQYLRRRTAQRPCRAPAGPREVPTRIVDEDTYPVGGFASLSNRGNVESLLQSQLAYMERAERPDLFDMKYLRDELYYYSRDENQFLHRRRAFIFVFHSDVDQARRHVSVLPAHAGRYQRIILLLGLVHAVCHRLTQWLSSEALHYDFYFADAAGEFPLRQEHELLQMLFREQMEAGTVQLFPPPAKRGPDDKVRQPAGRSRNEGEEAVSLVELCARRSRRSQVHVLHLSMTDHVSPMDNAVVARLVLNKEDPLVGGAADTPLESSEDWPEAMDQLLRVWL